MRTSATLSSMYLKKDGITHICAFAQLSPTCGHPLSQSKMNHDLINSVLYHYNSDVLSTCTKVHTHTRTKTQTHGFV